jgi:glycine cleavage system protein P-like pyridoxal-binding family
MVQPTDFEKEVNLLGDKLTTVDDFGMSYENITTEIYDEANDRAQFLLDGEIVAQYVYSGPGFYPIFVNEALLIEALEIMEDIEVDM